VVAVLSGAYEKDFLSMAKDRQASLRLAVELLCRRWGHARSP
jgi:hypothetical protein